MAIYKLILPDGTAVTSGADQKNALKSVTLTETVNAGTELTLGSACAFLLEAAVITAQPLNLSAGDEVELFRGEEKLGIFVLEKPTCPSPNTARLTGYDRIIKLDRDLTSWLASQEGFPMDMLTFAKAVCAACGLTLANTRLPNGDMTVEKFTGDGVTGRQLMQWVGEASGCFLRANADGQILLEGYTPSGITLRPAGERYYFALSFEDYEVAPVDAVRLRTEAGLWPAEGGNGYIITGNPLLRPGEGMEDRLEAIRAAIPYGYRPCTVSMPVQPGLRAGQSVTVVDGSGASFTALAMGVTTAGNKMTLHCTGSRRRDDTAAVNGKTPAQTAAEHKLYAQSAAQKAVQSQTQADIFLKLTDNGRLQGVFMEDGELYINASYLKAGTIDASLLKVGRITSANSKAYLDLNTGEYHCVSDTSEVVLADGNVEIYNSRGNKIAELVYGDGGGAVRLFNQDGAMQLALAAYELGVEIQVRDADSGAMSSGTVKLQSIGGVKTLVVY